MAADPQEPNSLEQVTEIVLEVLEAPEERRAAVMRLRCGEDAALRAAVERALVTETEGAVSLPLPVAAMLDRADPLANEFSIGSRIGPYEITRTLGQGGMGSVYLACRTIGYKSTVAIKVVQQGLGSAEVMQRFRDEIQFQAALGKHPFIAALLDASETDSGVPYFVMEYVDGMHIDRYCDHHRLTLEERLRLFQRVCEAVQFAHQNTVIHRDLKPSNILITADGTPRLIDFGIARLFNPELGFQGEDRTHSELRALTPAYASPEQASGETLTTSADVYSLGVILYELLTGSRPHRVESDSPEELVRILCEQRPARPSDMVSQQITARMGHGKTAVTLSAKVGESRNLSLSQLRRVLRGDLDMIVLMALQREPRSRYASAEQLSADIERHLSGDPVLAQPGTYLYRTRKFLGRNWLAVGAVAVLVISMLGGVLSTTIQWHRAEQQRELAVEESKKAATAAHQAELAGQAEQRERQRAEREADTATAVVEFLNELLSAAQPSELGHATTVREAVDAAAGRVADAFVDQPEVEAVVRCTLGTTYRSLSLLDEAEAQFHAALDLQLQTDGPDSLDTLTTMDLLAGVLRSRGYDADLQASSTLRKQVVATRTRLQGADHPDAAAALGNLANVLSKQGKHDEALGHYQQSYEVLSRALGPEASDTITMRYNIASTLFDVGRPQEAARLLDELWTSLHSGADPTAPFALQVTNQLATVLTELGNHERAESLFHETLEGRRQRLGEQHLYTLSTMRRLTRLLVDERAKHADAIPMVRECLRLHEERFPRGAGLTFGVRQTLARALIGTGNLDEAETVLLETHAILSEERGSKHRYAREAAQELVEFYEQQGEVRKAEQLRQSSEP